MERTASGGRTAPARAPACQAIEGAARAAAVEWSRQRPCLLGQAAGRGGSHGPGPGALRCSEQP